MLIATSPRLSSDQGKNSTEDPYPVEVDCMSSKCDSGISSDKTGDLTYEEHSKHIVNTQSPYEHATDRIETKQSKVLSHNQRKIHAESSIYHNSVKPKTMQSDTQNQAKHAKESQGEEFIYYIQHAEAVSEELDSSLETAVQKDDVLQNSSVKSEESTERTLAGQSEELHCQIQMPTVQSRLCNPLQSQTVQSKYHTNHLQMSTLKSDKSYDILTLQSENPFKSTAPSKEAFTSVRAVNIQSEECITSSHSETVQSEEALKSFMTAILQSEEPCSSIQMSDALSAERTDCLQAENTHLEESCNLGIVTDQPEVQSKQFDPLGNASSNQSVDLYDSEIAQTTILEGHEAFYQPMQVNTFKVDFHHLMKTTEDQADFTVYSGQRSSTKFAEPYNVKQTSTVESEEMYLSCDIHWSDSVTANKVAVEGDLSIIKQK